MALKRKGKYIQCILIATKIGALVKPTHERLLVTGQAAVAGDRTTRSRSKHTKRVSTLL